ncbi:hypothetical protein M3650_01810 [Paenibacillus sp. MER TA 81-3]|uniref:hypothetical protein n=1 Tax=Paenibacillus sp. MER TA 81-3 TaxID=2939573 RepID=UPI00204194D1|nr:hypothetical protein [Paenibacillus sp. MER TA 81-3]MCM3337417.1 hypothetical protein [Paenibacillus sp. MER TA 81-3]
MLMFILPYAQDNNDEQLSACCSTDAMLEAATQGGFVVIRGACKELEKAKYESH